ncbi:ATPase, T2SS/T4P/T4SS family [Dactylosporangium sp. NPDC000244]|uniref:CpaF family protein n=1 Tax=Dactylosporangium sp. NPDC000244 TaxID=3154365 RepID=UPI00332C198F
MSAPFGPSPAVVAPVNGRRYPGQPAAAEPNLDAAVLRQIRREVAERLTRANRAHEAANTTPMPAEEREALTRRLISEALDAYATAEMQAGRPPLHPHVESRVARTVADALLGAGGLQPWLSNPDVEEIVANGCDQVFVRFADGTIEQVDPIADSDPEMVDLIRMLAARTGNDERRWDRAAPLLNLQLADGSRLNAVLDVVRRPSLSIRRHRYLTMTLPELIELGAIDTALAELFAAAIRARLNTVVGGPTGAGKTTFLRGLASAIPAWERLVTIEDTYELGFDRDETAHPNVVAMQARDANVEGEGEVDMAALFRNALRMVPSRVFVGEVRGHEVVPLLNAMSQGNDGSMSTIHASSSAGVFRKLVLYAAAAPERLDPATTNLHIAEGLHLVVQLRLTETGRRFVTSVREVVDADGLQVTSNEIFRPGPDGRAVPGAPPSTGLLDRLAFHGFDPALLQRREGWWNTTGPSTQTGRRRAA